MDSLNEVQAYDLDTQTVRNLPSLQIKRQNSACTFLKGNLYVFAGYGDSARTNSIEILNVAASS